VQRRRELDAVVAGLDAQRAVVLLGAPALEAARRLGPGLRLGESGLDLDEAVDALPGGSAGMAARASRGMSSKSARGRSSSRPRLQVKSSWPGRT